MSIKNAYHIFIFHLYCKVTHTPINFNFLKNYTYLFFLNLLIPLIIKHFTYDYHLIIFKLLINPK